MSSLAKIEIIGAAEAYLVALLRGLRKFDGGMGEVGTRAHATPSFRVSVVLS